MAMRWKAVRRLKNMFDKCVQKGESGITDLSLARGLVFSNFSRQQHIKKTSAERSGRLLSSHALCVAMVNLARLIAMHIHCHTVRAVYAAFTSLIAFVSSGTISNRSPTMP